MGVKQLNSYLKSNCKSLKKISLFDLKGKRIAIDASIYIYKYLTSNNLLENIFNMCFKFRQFNIHAVFVFDGKPPKEKDAELKKRSQEKKTAETKYKDLNKIAEQLVADLSNNDITESEKQEIMNEQNKIQTQMNDLKKKFVRINDDIINDVKTLIMACGLSYIESPCEADALCAHLIHTNKVYAVMSEDMDMFVYGCVRVLRYFSIMNNNCVLYNLNDILKELDVSKKDFRQICIYSGTDYSEKTSSFYDNMKIYNKNKNEIMKTSFYDFIMSEYCEQKKSDEESLIELKNIYEIFTKTYEFNMLNNVKINNMVYNTENIKNVLSKEKFIFV